MSERDEMTTAAAEVIGEPIFDITKEKETFDWSKRLTCSCCSCFPYVTQLVLVGCAGSLLFGMGLSLLNTCEAYISWEFHWCDFADGDDEITGCDLSKEYNAFLSASVFLGCAAGSMCAGVFSKWGRRMMMMISMGIIAVGTILSVCANGFVLLLIARLIVGFGGGMLTVGVPGYMAEVTPAEQRGQYGVSHQLFVSAGIFLGTVVGLPLTYASPMPEESGPGLEEIDTFAQVWWRIMLGMGLLPVVLVIYLVTVVYTFETPPYYAEKGLVADCAALLRRIHGKDDVQKEVEAVVNDIRDMQSRTEEGMTFFKAMRTPSYRRAMWVGILLSAFQQLGGINVFVAMSNKLFADAGLDGHWPTVMSIIQDALLVIFVIPAVPLIEKLGRKQLLLIGTMGSTLVMAPASICYWVLEEGSKVTEWLAIVGIMLFIVLFALTYGPVLWVYLAEMFPSEMRATGAGVATAVNWLCGVALVFASAFLPIEINFTLFTAMSLLSIFVVWFGVLETKGLPLGESPFVRLR